MRVVLSLLALTVVLSTSRTYGQLTQVEFKNQAVNVKLKSDESLAQAIQSSSDGGYFVASRRNGKVALVDPTTKGEKIVDMGTTDGALLTKYGKDGKPVMCVAFEGNVSIQKIAATPDGGAIVGGVYTGPMLLVNASGEALIAADASTDLTRLFVAEVKADGTLGTVLLPKHEKHVAFGEEIKGPSPEVTNLVYDGEKGVLMTTFVIGNKVTFGSTTYIAPLEDQIMGDVAPSVLCLQLSWPAKAVVASLQMHKSWERSLYNVFGPSAVSSLVVSPDGADGKYVASSFFGQIDEVDNLTASEITTKHGEGKEKLDSTKRIIVERRKADGSKMWSNTVVLANFHLNEYKYSDATVNYIAPVGDGNRFVVVGLFDGELMFDDGKKLTSKPEGKGYSVDAFVILGDAQTGQILDKRSLGLSLAGYAYSLKSEIYPLSAVLDGEDLVLALPFQESISVGSTEYKSKDGGKEDGKVRYNSLIAHVSLAPGDNLAMQAALSLTHAGKVRIDGLAKIKSGKYAYVGSVKSRDDVGTNENTKLYVNGDAVVESIADAKGATVSIAGKVKLDRKVRVEMDVLHPELVTITLQKDGESEITYGPTVKLPRLENGKKLTVRVEWSTSQPKGYELLPISINGEERSEYTFNGDDERIVVKAGAYVVEKPIVVTVKPEGSAELTLKVAGAEKVFKGEAGDPKVTVKNGESVEGLAVKPEVGYKLQEILIQGNKLGEGVTSYTLQADDQRDALEIKVRMEATEFPILCKVVNASDGKVSVLVDGNPVNFDSDGKSDVNVRAGGKVKVEAVPNDRVKFDAEVTVNGNPIDGEEFVVGGGKCDIEVKFVAKPEFEVAVEVKGDITYGKVTVAVDGGTPVVFEGDPKKYPNLKVYPEQKLTIVAGQMGKGKFESLEVAGAEFTSGEVYTVPSQLSGNKLNIQATFSRSTAVEAKELATVALRSNPVSKEFVVEGTWSGELRYALYNALGERILSGKSAYQGLLRISAQDLPAGVYFLRLVDATGATTTLKAVRR